MFSRCIMILLAFLPMIGCIGGIRDTTTARTATEILLVSTAAERAIQNYKVDKSLSGKKVTIDDSHYDSVDKPYVSSALREHLSAAGAIVVADGSDYTVEVRNGTLGIFDSDFTMGIPGLPVALGFGAELPPVITPPISVFKRDTSQGWCKMQLWIYKTADNTFVSKSDDLWGSSYYNQWIFLFIGPFDGSNDIYPE
ncbi:DUF6655 family protein [Candidatus Uabimicrobium amorphum]|uniref:Uncharacterized protein n=1 Tax=Uabimicrobium amorphum TaxID=2596890 RepID=A0A5S9F233_UABAM|nr:DUF6655 family protein [Candidatus Uabimicrobium amorphum]BBM82831.1 hypothetical protein UABAM_01174 [Candidatus Uabimicrobium amorphum]